MEKPPHVVGTYASPTILCYTVGTAKQKRHIIMTYLSVAKLDICIGSSLYQAGVDNEGRAFVGESFYLVATAQNGARHKHHARFKSIVVRRLMDEDATVIFEDIREEVLQKLEALLRKIHQAGEINLDYWDYADPEYGSTEYINQGIEEQRAYQERYAN